MSITNRITAAVSKIIPSSLLKKESYHSNTSDVTGTGAHKYQRYVHSSNNRHALSYRTYRGIMEDSQVKVGLEILKYFLISKNYTLTSNSDDDEDVEIKEFIQDCFDNMETPFRKVLKDILTAIRYGYSVHERVYTLRENRVVLKGLYPVHIKTLQNNPFITDDKTGELIGIHQESDYGSVDLPIEKCLYYAFDNEFDEFYGNSILNEIKTHVDDKKDVVDWWMTYAEKNENPLMYGKTANTVSRDNMLRAFDDISGGTTNLVIGKDEEVGVLESSHRGETFQDIIDYNDQMIFRRMFIGTLLFGDNNKTGAYAQSNTQKEITLMIMNGILADVAAEIQKTVDDLTVMNFGANAKSPLFNFENFIEKDVLNLLNTLKDYVNAGAIDTNSYWFSELIAKAVSSESDVKVDLEHAVDNPASRVGDGYMDPLPGDSTVRNILSKIL